MAAQVLPSCSPQCCWHHCLPFCTLCTAGNSPLCCICIPRVARAPPDGVTKVCLHMAKPQSTARYSWSLCCESCTCTTLTPVVVQQFSLRTIMSQQHGINDAVHGYRLAAALEASQQFQCPVDHLRASKQRSAYATSSSQDYQQDDTAPLWNTMPNDNTCICFTASEQVLYTTSMPDSEEEWHE